jgi:hypothetical protein
MTTFYCLRFDTPPTWRVSSRVYIPQEQGGPVIPPGTGFPFQRLLRLTGLRGGIRPRLHTGVLSTHTHKHLGTNRTENTSSSRYYIVACVTIARECVSVPVETCLPAVA